MDDTTNDTQAADSAIENNTGESIATQNLDLDSLEAQLDKVLGDTVETIPVVEEKPIIPTFELGAPPAHSEFQESPHTILGVQETPYSEIKTIPVESSQEEPMLSSGFHTISGGPETLKESMEKTLPAVHRMTPPPQSPEATKPKVNIAAILEEEKKFLSPVLFFWFSAVTFISFLVGVIFPLMVEHLLSKDYFLIEENGTVYRNGALAFPSTLPENMLTLTLWLTIFSIIVLIITGTIDYGIKKKCNEWIRVVAYLCISAGIGYIVFRFFRDQGVTLQQVKDIIVSIQNIISLFFQNIREDKPVF